ncbi:MAG TPA: YbaK/EbsC family protein [Atribacterota bacterium]|nr:YbaK/EbsC family protein [Atribacterota bacterium]
MKKLFDKTKINQMELKNRFVRSATWEGLANPDGSCSEKIADMMLELAKGQVGLIITSHAYVSQCGQGSIRQLGIYDDRLISSYKKMVEEVHKEGSKIVLQISHAGARALAQLKDSEPFGPSSLKIKDVMNCREITTSEILKMTEDFKMAAVKAKKAGFDGVQIHAAHGYLLNQFLSPFFNKRKDEYGGSIENRARLILEILQAIRSELGRQFTVLIKLNSDDFIEGGFTPEEMVQVAELLEVAGIDAVELSGGTSLKISNYSSSRVSESDSKEDEAYYGDAAKLYKEKISVPLILVGGIRSYELAKELVEKELVDYISLCRPLIREPDLIKRWQAGDIKKARCISCNGCFVPARAGEGLYCNPVARRSELQRMDSYEEKIKKYIKNNHIKAEHLSFKTSCHSVEEAVQTVNASIEDFVKNICLIDKKGNLIVAIVKGEDRVSTKKIGKVLGIERPRTANPQEILEKTGFICGGVPSFGYQATFLIDPKVMEKVAVYSGGGSEKSLIKISPQELLKANQGQVIKVKK